MIKFSILKTNIDGHSAAFNYDHNQTIASSLSKYIKIIY